MYYESQALLYKKEKRKICNTFLVALPAISSSVCAIVCTVYIIFTYKAIQPILNKIEQQID